MIAEFIKPDDVRWARFLEQSKHDFYHLPSYVALSAEYEGGEPMAFYAEDNNNKFLAPMIAKSIPSALGAPDGWCDATTPYGYPGPLVIGDSGTESFRKFLDALKLVSAQRHIISSFFRLHPLLAMQEDAFTKHGSLLKHGRTVFVDLSLPIDEILSQRNRSQKGGLKKLEKLGFKARIDDWGTYEGFIKIYKSTMQRVSAESYYHFPDDYFHKLRKALDRNIHLCTVVAPNGDLAAASIFTVTNDIVQYHLGGTAEGYLPLAPSKLVCDRITYWAKENNHAVFHLGGGLGGREDSLFYFKTGLSKLRADFHTFRMILNEEAYEHLVGLWCKKCGAIADNESSFFPIYRLHYIDDNELIESA